jgi:hypothetical protein
MNRSGIGRRETGARLAALAAAAALLPAPAPAVDVSGEADLTVNSDCVWRGQVRTDEPCLQPRVSAGAGNLQFDLWGTWDIIPEDDTWERNRVDATVAYGWECGIQMLSAGMVGYIYHDGPRRDSLDTFEVLLGYALDVPSLPSLTLYYDFDRVDGYYATLSVAHSFEMQQDRVALDLGLELGAGDDNQLAALFDHRSRTQRRRDNGAPLFRGPSLVDLTASVSVPYHLKPDVLLMPAVSYMTLVGPAVRRVVEEAEDDTEKLSFALTLLTYF